MQRFNAACESHLCTGKTLLPGLLRTPCSSPSLHDPKTLKSHPDPHVRIKTQAGDVPKPSQLVLTCISLRRFPFMSRTGPK